MPGEISRPYRPPYDREAHELAEHYLQDELSRLKDPASFKARADSLARYIQEAVEDWFATHDEP